MKKNLFLTFCFSFIPGAGQMYQTYMKRGVSIMSLFAIFCAITASTGMAIFAIPLPIIYAYAFFDTYNIRNKIEDGKENDDDYIWNETEYKKIFEKINFSKKSNIIAAIFIMIGIYLLLNNVVYSIAYRYDIYYLEVLLGVILRYLPSILVGAISIFIGTKFIVKK